MVKRVPGGFRRVGSGVGSGVVVVSIVVGIQRRRRHSFAFGILFVVMHWSHVHLKKRRQGADVVGNRERKFREVSNTVWVCWKGILTENTFKRRMNE